MVLVECGGSVTGRRGRGRGVPREVEDAGEHGRCREQQALLKGPAGGAMGPGRRQRICWQAAAGWNGQGHGAVPVLKLAGEGRWVAPQLWSPRSGEVE